MKRSARIPSLLLALAVAGCFGRNDRQILVETIMKNPDRLDSICTGTPLGAGYVREYLGHEQSRLDVIQELRNFNGYYYVEEWEAPNTGDVRERTNSIRVLNDIIGRSMDFQFRTTDDGRTWQLNNIVIENCIR